MQRLLCQAGERGKRATGGLPLSSLSPDAATMGRVEVRMPDQEDSDTAGPVEPDAGPRPPRRPWETPRVIVSKAEHTSIKTRNPGETGHYGPS